MWVLLGVSDDTVENETFVYFIGVFDDLSAAKNERDNLIRAAGGGKKLNDYIIKSVCVNTAYDYSWSYNEEDELH